MSFLSDFGGAILDGVADIGMGLFNDYRSRKNTKKAYNRQLYMSNSAHQREVNDLIAAGLNPVLSAGGNGAATLSVPAAHSQMTKGNYAANYNSARQISLQNNLLEAQAAQAESTVESNTAMAESHRSNAELNNANRELTNAKTVAQEASNVIEMAKSDFFKHAPKELKENMINALMYPNSTIGQARGLTDRIGQHAHRATNRFFDAIDKFFSQRSKDAGSQGGHKDAGSQGGHNSARKVKEDSERRKKARELIERLEREQQKEREDFRKKYPKGRSA